MTPNVIFILLTNPWDVIVAIKTREEGYRNYDLQDLEHGWDYRNQIEKNPLLEELDELPSGITSIYEWPNYEERFEKALIYKNVIPVKELDYLLGHISVLFDTISGADYWSEWDEGLKQQLHNFRLKYTQ